MSKNSFIKYFSEAAFPIARSPFSLKNLRALKELKKLLSENHYDILHCHTPMGGVIGRLAEKKQMDYVTFTGYTKDVADYCRLSDLLVMPSFQEGLPMAMIEAIATGLPVVASDIRGHNDVIEDCANGFLFGTDDVTGFEKAILTLYKNPALRTEMGARNIERAKSFSVEKAVGAMDAIYHTVM